MDEACSRSDTIRDSLVSFYRAWKHKTVQVSALIRLILQICQPFERRYVVIDGLDELGPDARNSIAALLKKLRAHSVHFLVTGRPHIFHSTDLVRIRATHAKLEARQEDIEAFVQAQVGQNNNLQILTAGNRNLQSRLINRITSKAAGQ
jgi:hypothetical protein